MSVPGPSPVRPIQYGITLRSRDLEALDPSTTGCPNCTTPARPAHDDTPLDRPARSYRRPECQTARPPVHGGMRGGRTRRDGGPGTGPAASRRPDRGGQRAARLLDAATTPAR